MKKLFLTGALAAVMTFAAAAQISCSRPAQWTRVRWTGEGNAPVLPPEIILNEKPLPVGRDQSLLFQAQKIEDVEVAGSYYKQINEDGEARFVDYRWMSEIPLSVRRDLLLMRAQKPFVLSYFLKAHEGFSRRDLVEGPQLTLSEGDSPQVLWKLIFQEPDGTLQGFFLNKDMEVLLQKRLGSAFIDATARLFPNGPLKSDLQEVFLRGLLSTKGLSSSAVKITTEANLLASPGDHNEMNFAVGDLRFSQVQTYFYLSQALEWLEKTFHFELPFVLEAETQKGFPEKTNTAFYFQHKIRLGEGDGEVFDRIPMDPSIVTHESMHAVIEAVAGLPYDQQGGSLNEAFADFLTAMQLNNPKMGETAYKKASFKRTIENDLKLSDADGGLYHDSGIVSGLLWSLQKSVGPSTGLRLAWGTLLRLNVASDFEGFKRELLLVAENEGPETQKKVQDEMKKRGWLP